MGALQLVPTNLNLHFLRSVVKENLAYYSGGPLKITIITVGVINFGSVFDIGKYGN